MIERHAAGMLSDLLSSDLRYLMSISHVVLMNNQITARHIEREYGMPVQAWSALYAVATYPGLRAKDIRVLFPRPQNSISRAIRLLIDRDLVQEAASDDDGRAKHLFPTPKGTVLLAEIKAKALARQDEIFDSLTKAERETFLTLCNKIVGSEGLARSQAMP